MTEETQEQGRKGIYGRIYSKVQGLSSEVAETVTPAGFDRYIVRLNVIQTIYIREFDQMKHAERTDASLLLNMLQNQIHGRLDVFRACAMRGELKPRK